MNRKRFAKRLIRTLAPLFVMAVLVGCPSWAGEQRYMEATVPAERLRTVEALDLEAMSAPEGEAAPAEGPTPEEPPATRELSLEECRVAALENNLDLKAALVNPAIAAETVSQEEARFEGLFFANVNFAKTDTATASTLTSAKADFFSADAGVRLPLRTGGTLTFDLPYARQKTNNAFSTLNPSYTADFSASISQPLLRNSGTRASTHAIRIARYNRQMSEARTKLEVISVIAAADRVYWRLYAARRELEVRKNQYDLAVAQLDRARRKVQAGTASEVEVIRAETGVAERLEAIIVAENSVRRRQRELKRALSIANLGLGTPTIVIPATRPDPVHYELDAARLVAAAFENRTELVELQLQLAEDASTIDFNRNQTLPLLALGYTYRINGLGGSSGDAFDLMTDKRFEDHRVGLQLEAPLGNTAARSRLRQAIFTRVRRLATREARKLTIEQEVRNTVDTMQAGWQRVLANRQRTILAARNLDAEERQFEQGLRTSTDVLGAQTQLADAQSAEVAALTEYQIAQIDLAYATGTLLGAAKVRWEPTASQ